MKPETAQAIELHTLKLAVVWLLAQEAKRTPNGIDALHTAMAQHLMTAAQAAGQDHPQAALALEVALTQSVDNLMGLVRQTAQQ